MQAIHFLFMLYSSCQGSNRTAAKEERKKKRRAQIEKKANEKIHLIHLSGLCAAYATLEKSTLFCIANR